MDQEEKKEQYKILAKEENSNNQYEIIMTLNNKKNLICIMIEPDESLNKKYINNYDLKSLEEIHPFFNNKNRIKDIKDAYNELIKLLESNKNQGKINEINVKENIFLIIPYQPDFKDFIKFELKKEEINAKDKIDFFLKTTKN